MRKTVLQTLREDLEALQEGLVRTARLQLLAVLCEPKAAWQEQTAARAARHLNLAGSIDTFLIRHLGLRTAVVEWPLGLQPDEQGAIDEAHVDQAVLQCLTQNVLTTVMARAHDAYQRLSSNLLLKPALHLLEMILLDLGPVSEGSVMPCLRLGRAPMTPRKALSGPRYVPLDPIFAPTYSALDTPRAKFGRSVEETAQYFWTLSAQESLASELCALSAIEYDGLPLSFYLDMAKQAWDEARHSVYYLQVARHLLDEVNATQGSRLPIDSATLPIPVERNFYEAIWNADLVQRLVLMHHDSETPGISHKRGMIQSPFCRQRPEICDAMEIDLYDEISHSRIGNHWLRHLVPNRTTRREAIETTRQLRPVLLLTAAAHHSGRPLISLTSTFARDGAPSAA